MEKETKGTVAAVATQWWLKINTKPVRLGALDGAIFPHIVKVIYSVNGTEYTRRKWVSAGSPVPSVGSTVTVVYSQDKPQKARIVL